VENLIVMYLVGDGVAADRDQALRWARVYRDWGYDLDALLENVGLEHLAERL
jgi:hypothetical protein